MFRKKGKKEQVPEQASQTPETVEAAGTALGAAVSAQEGEAVTATEGREQAKENSVSTTRASEKPLETVIAKGVTITGNIKCDGDIQIFGLVNGDVEGRLVAIEEGALISGKVGAVSAVIAGSVEGIIDADVAKFLATGSLDGDLICKSLAVDEGAFLRGGISRRGDTRPSRDQGPVEERAEKPHSTTVESTGAAVDAGNVEVSANTVTVVDATGAKPDADSPAADVGESDGSSQATGPGPLSLVFGRS